MNAIWVKFFIICNICISIGLFAQPQANQNNWIEDQNDQTDIFAIPLDSSEEEEHLEMQELDHLQKKPLKKNPPQK